jgi:phage-related protein
MPTTEVIYYREADGTVPVLKWLGDLSKKDRAAAEKCVARVNLLRNWGHELRRPHTDYLRDGIYELRVRAGRSQHRLLYFFHGNQAVVLAHGLTKEKAVPKADLDRAVNRMRLFETAPQRHTFRQE